MQPNYLALVNIFGAETRYTVPLFQRPYVWKKDDQWLPLWDDLSDLADRVYLAETDKSIAGHFLGTVVLEQTQSQTGSIGRREIIDGQQRLTTLQIVLKAAEHALEEVENQALEATNEQASKAASVAFRQLAALTKNPAYADDEEKYKVWPTNDDRPAFREVMDSPNAQALEASDTRLAAAYHFFIGRIREWLGKKPNEPRRSTTLAAALKDHLRLIVLDLDDNDEPQAIFETLNANGAPLLPSDLIKNWLLWELTRQLKPKHFIESSYNQYWRQFDSDSNYWRTKIGTGHAARPRVDLFLQNWLTRRTKIIIPSKHIYAKFLEHVDPRSLEGATATACDVPALMQDVHADAASYRTIEAPTGTSRFDTFLRRLKKLDIVVFHPLLLALMRRQGSGQDDLDTTAIVLESYLVRRVICWEQTRGYGALALALIGVVGQVPPGEPAAPFISNALKMDQAEASAWPDDQAFKKAWCENKFYGGYRRARVQLVLEALEEFYQRDGKKGEPIVQFDFSSLEIEHILPQKWQSHWPLSGEPEALKNREDRLHRIGNLTLVSSPLNPTLSNAPWTDRPNGKKGKRSALDEHSKLRLNAKLVKGHTSVWDEQEIDARSMELFEAAKKIWPRPS